MRLRFRLRLCLDLNVQQDTGRQLSTALPVLTLVLSQSNKTRLSIFLSTRTGWLLTLYRSPCSYNWIFGFWLGLLRVYIISSNF